MKKLTYDSALSQLNEILEALESGEVSIDLLSEKVKKARELLAFCQQKLRDTEALLEPDSAETE